MMYETYSTEVGCMTRSLESYFNLSVFIKDDSAMESRIFDRVSGMKMTIKDFFTKLIKAISNFILKYIGKGKLLNIKAVKTIHKYNTKWVKMSSGPLDSILKLDVDGDVSKQKDIITKASNVFDEIGKDIDEFQHQVNTDIINSPKIHQYTYYKQNEFLKIERIALLFEESSLRLMEKAADYSLKSNDRGNNIYNIYNKLIMLMSKTAGVVSEALMKSIASASYISQKNNSTVEFEEEEVEVEFDFD